MNTFSGFSNQETFTQLPDSFFNNLLNEIDDLTELRVTIYILWRLAHMESWSRSVNQSEIEADQGFMQEMEQKQLVDGLQNAVKRGSLLCFETNGDKLYFINSTRGRVAVEALKKGDRQPDVRKGSNTPHERPNIFRLYEKTVGPLTPMIAEALKDAEKTYSEDQIEKAFKVAVTNNKRFWKYIEAILRSRKEAEDAKKQTGRDSEEDRRRYVEGDYADFIEH
jgi:DNA replication protein